MSGPWRGRTRRAFGHRRFAVGNGRGGPLRLFLLSAAVAIAMPAHDARPQPAPDAGGRRDGTDVLVTVGEERIVKADLAAALRRLGAEALPAGEARQRATTLAIEQLVEERLLRAEIARQKIRATDADIDRGVAQLIAQGMPPAEAAGEQVRTRLELEVCTKKLLLPQLDEAAFSATLEKHRRELDGTRLRLSHVLLRPDPGRGDEAIPAAVRRAEAIRAQIVDGGMPFAEAAARHSAGPSRHRGGDLGLAVRGSPHHEAFAAAAFALDQGELSRPVVTPFGVHLITVTAVEPGTADPRALRPKVEQLWARRALADLVARLRQSTSITYAPGVPHVDRDGPGAAGAPRDPGATGPN
jgi:peptidyl-prolyl cis-trans isomerase C